MTSNERKRFKSENMKLSAIKEILENGKSVSEVANQIGVHRARVYNWLKTFENDGTIKVAQSKFTNKPSDPQLTSENKKLRKKLKEKELENEILKKFQAFLKGNV